MFRSKIQNFETKFEQLNAEKVSKELNIENLARDTASHEAPTTNSISLDHNENKIIVYIENQAKVANDFVHDKILVFAEILSKTLTSINDLDGLSYIHNKFENESHHLFTQTNDEIKSLKSIKNKRKIDLTKFKEKHNIEREENSPTSLIFHISIILLILVGESFFNAFFFSKGNELGLLGGLFQSFTVSIVNLSLAWFCIILWRKSRNITYSNTQKNSFISVVILIIIFVISFHLLVGHYRDALNINPEEAYLISVKSFSEDPFILIDFNSWILVILGIFFFTIQIIDIYKMKDPYPGYTEITKIHESAKKEYEDYKYKVLEDAKKIEEDIYKEIKLIIRKADAIYSEVKVIPDTKQRLEGKYTEQLMHLTNLLNLLISEYRSINKTYRKTDVPKYFDDKDIQLTTQKIKFNYIQERKKLNELYKRISNLPHIEAQTYANVRKISEELKNKSEIFNEI